MPRRGGGKRRKRRTHFVPSAESDADGIPRSLVLCRGKVPTGVRDLVPDMREIFLPYTAQKLRERKSNNLRDFVAIAAQFQLTHIWLFSATDRAPYLRVARLPQGPTLTFRIKEYTLAAHVRATQKRPVVLSAAEFAHSPLLVMNNFTDNNAAPGVRLMGETLRHCFPPVDVHAVNLAAMRRVLLVDRDTETGLVHMRHYALRVHAAGLSRPVRKMVVKRRVPKLARLEDVAELMDGGGPAGVFSSDSEMEDARVHPEVTLPQDVKTLRKGASSKLRLVEVGPRLTLELVKVEAGFCQGAVLFHKHRQKTAEEVAADQARIDAREALKKKRKMDQEANVERKAEAKRAKKERRKEHAAARAHTMEQKNREENSDNENCNETENPPPNSTNAHTHPAQAAAEPAAPRTASAPQTRKTRRGGRRSKPKAGPSTS